MDEVHHLVLAGSKRYNLATGRVKVPFAVLTSTVLHSPSLPGSTDHDVSFLWLLSFRHPLRATDKGRNILISPSFPEMEYNLLPFPPFSV
ncbi:hypothetical protein T05_242 [Trichinella murrelli]|uniref:Uncharacterized protein n=1 Tax=Trichinella murrelli TaxID=144512 RepID=A0A0V0T6L1_9BILA|nr:hypothetical protein T05_13924 [Trichinella murrelli]KRX34291.1 hypothetical protein T05_6584 [Trichinella murrelli]KRX34638.1 hypothetical protein T05_242 [Trichinella murrelli]